jgi:ribonucleoside-diphosphate reductase alpha chain
MGGVYEMSKSWIDGEDYPKGMSEEALNTLKKGYLGEGESPRGLYLRVAKTAARRLNLPGLESKLFDYLFKQYISLATPVAANFGLDRGLPISCYSSAYTGDSIDSIMLNLTEVAKCSQYGGGTSVYVNDIRAKGCPISRGGKSDGVVPFLKMFESVISGINQGSTRRGIIAIYLDIEHDDFHSYIDIRKLTGDSEQKCLTPSFNHAICISDSFMEKLKNGDEEARLRWYKLIKTRLETGEPYIFFTNNANKNLEKGNPDWVNGSNACSEIFLPSTPEETAICCLSSMNLSKYDEWKDTDAVETLVYLLEAVLDEFIEKTEHLNGFARPRKFAINKRAIGCGALGWHTLLQQKMIAFDSFKAMQLNNEIFRLIKEKTDKASLELGKLRGAITEDGKRNYRLRAIAPTVSNSIISGGVSQGIEPIAANVFLQNSAKGSFLKKNKILEKLLESKGQNTFEVWSSISSNQGSVQHLDFLSQEERDVFKTAREIDQRAIIRQASQRQAYIDQGQSINLFFQGMRQDPLGEGETGTDRREYDATAHVIDGAKANYVNKVHLLAYELGLKSLYYCRVLPAIHIGGSSVDYNDDVGCKSCEG